MKPQGTQVRSVTYDARVRQFEAEIPSATPAACSTAKAFWGKT